MALCPATMCKVDIVDQLMQQYNGDPKDCFDDNKNELPLYMCFGLIIRCTDNAMFSYPWELFDDEVSVSTSFLHKYAPFAELYDNHDAGLILSPRLQTPDECEMLTAYCSFAVDANSNHRSTNHGCTTSRVNNQWEDELFEFPEAPEKSQFCREQGVTTVDKWMRHSQKEGTEIMGTEYTFYMSVCQCAFEMSEQYAREDFLLSLDVNVHIATNFGRNSYNEVLFSLWSDLERAPIQSFFYLNGSKNGLKKARKYRKAFMALTKRKIPIVDITLPTRGSDIIIKKAPKENVVKRIRNFAKKLSCK